jgi:hypothetical protein
MDIGTNMVEKNGLFLERYSVWDISSSVSEKNRVMMELDYVAIDEISNFIKFDEID